MRKKVGGLKGGGKPSPKRSRKVGAIRKQRPIKETKDCGCVVEYPDRVGAIGNGTPKYVKPCKQHEVLIPMWKADKDAKVVGGLTPGAISKGTTRGHRQCQHCVGRHIDGNWVHDPDCPYVVVLWDFDDSRWRCPFGCEGVRLSTSRTHVWNCRFWDEHGNTTPF